MQGLWLVANVELLRPEFAAYIIWNQPNKTFQPSFQLDFDETTKIAL